MAAAGTAVLGGVGPPATLVGGRQQGSGTPSAHSQPHRRSIISKCAALNLQPGAASAPPWLTPQRGSGASDAELEEESAG